MTNRLDMILDECINRINRGESADACLADYPEYRQELEPLLSAVLGMKASCSFIPSARTKSYYRQRLTAALVTTRERRGLRKPLSHRLLGWSKVWAPALAVIAIGIIVYFGLRPGITIPITLVQANPSGNFAFLLSDEVNDIGDFSELNVSVSRVSLRLSGDQERNIEFVPAIQVVNLVNLQDNRAQEIWKGDIPQGEYTKVVLEVSEVSGFLKDTGEAVNIKLPSSRLQISKPFTVLSGVETNFVYDLTVVRAGNSGQYILKPQIDQSGSSQNFIKVNPGESHKQ
ncbi:DUF4382 domain-containing protein [Chloroflexota bacterium]